MSQPILYIAPQPPTVGGIADYAARFRLALESADIGHQDIAPENTVPTRTEVRAIAADIKQRSARGELSRYRLAHVEIARFSYREYFYAHALRRFSQLPVVLTLHEPGEVVERPYRYLGLERQPRPVRIIRKVLDEGFGPRQKATLLERAAKVLTLGSKGQADLVSWNVSPTKRSIIPHVSYGTVPRRQTGKPLSIVFGGFYGAHKGLEILLEAYKKVLAQGRQETKLIITGASFDNAKNSPLDTLLDASGIAKTNLTRTGFLSETGLQELFASADIMVVPYLPELPAGSSAMLMRSLSAGAATICSDILALAQDVTDRQTALMFPAGNAAALAERLAELLDNEALRNRLGQAAGAQIASSHSPQAVGTVIEKIYNEATSA